VREGARWGGEGAGRGPGARAGSGREGPTPSRVPQSAQGFNLPSHPPSSSRSPPSPLPPPPQPPPSRPPGPGQSAGEGAPHGNWPIPLHAPLRSHVCCLGAPPFPLAPHLARLPSLTFLPTQEVPTLGLEGGGPCRTREWGQRAGVRGERANAKQTQSWGRASGERDASWAVLRAIGMWPMIWRARACSSWDRSLLDAPMF